MKQWVTETGERLTPREIDVLHNMTRGLTSKDSGLELDISSLTVEKHRARAMLKLNARNGIHATVIAIEIGMVDFNIAPRMMTQATTAKYCGISVPTLIRTCPVQPTELANGVKRYDKTAIDRWLDALANGEPTTPTRMASLDDWKPNESKRRKAVPAS